MSSCERETYLASEDRNIYSVYSKDMDDLVTIDILAR
jgi:hypothetical protein